MKCKKVQQLIYLNRPGELNARDQRRLKHHLEKCFECVKHQIRLQKTETHYRTLTNMDIKPKDGGKLTENIINEIKNMKTPRSYNFYPVWSNHLLNKFAILKVRIALTSLVLLIVAGFISQEMIILHKVAKLEKQMAHRSQNNHEFDMLFYKQEFLEKSLLSEIVEQDHLHIDQSPNDFIIIDKKTFNKLITAYKKSQIKNRLLIDMIQKIDSNYIFNKVSNKYEMEDTLTIKMNKKEIEKWIHKL